MTDVPVTERLANATGARWSLVVAAFAALPVAHLVVVEALLAWSGLVAWDAAALIGRLGGRLLNVYLIVLGFLAARRIAAALAEVDPTTDAGDRVHAAVGWAWPPAVLAVGMSIAFGLTHVDEFGLATVIATPLPFVVSLALAFLIRLPQMTAFWTAVVALVRVFRLGGRPLPAAFPDDRSLGLRPVGELMLTILVVYAAAFLPSFLFGVWAVVDFLFVAGLFAAGVAAMVLAVWRIHERMAAERSRAMAGARARYAAAYRAAATAARGDATAAAEIATAAALLQGAESIHEWPFDERMQRIAAIVLTGVITGIIVRAILFAFGA